MLEPENNSNARGRLLAHRGAWLQENLTPNSLEALFGALQAGFGLETDIRDLSRHLVISHDPPNSSVSRLLDFLIGALEFPSSNQALLALNIKSDGLGSLLTSDELDALASFRHFFFDMSTPEIVKFVRQGLEVGIRFSEFENLSDQLKIISSPKAIWVDGFYTDCLESQSLSHLEGLQMDLVFVSPELHGRNPAKVWRAFADNYRENPNWYLCTDHPWEVLELMGNG